MWFHIIGMLCVIPAILLTERDSSSNRRHEQDFDYQPDTLPSVK
ncbi:MAG TPA: hypothetical protein VEL31_14230 [Ktedonobacteraceae bacterium]|nr:hypothetical protein [Ktedonobacteraceae bacterium]